MFHNATIDGVIELSRKEVVGEDTDIKINDKVPNNLGMIDVTNRESSCNHSGCWITYGSAYI